ncbi:MAG: SDR family oxidoreductase [Ignavibacteriae bacterium]|nr:SDR family oxidoreductase [Ignavibacteriota bacterium]
MNLLIIGATGGTGRQLVTQALEQGHTVTAFARNPAKVNIRHERLTVAQGNVLDYASLEKAVQGKDAILCALGHKRFVIPSSILSEGTKNILTAMNAHGLKRLICETSLSVGDSFGKLGLYYTLFVIPFIALFYFMDKGKQERLIRESDTEWTIVRPGQLTNGKKRGVYRHGPDVGNYILTVHISRADTADFMLKQVPDKTYLRKTVAVAY